MPIDDVLTLEVSVKSWHMLLARNIARDMVGQGRIGERRATYHRGQCSSSDVVFLTDVEIANVVCNCLQLPGSSQDGQVCYLGREL